MRWITRKNAKVDRIACPWLIRRFIDPEAEFFYVERDQVLSEAEKQEAISFDVEGGRYTHRDGKCTFEVLIEDFNLRDSALQKLAKIVHGADIEKDVHVAPESPGLMRIAQGFALRFPDDHEKLKLEFPLYDALYAYCKSTI